MKKSSHLKILCMLIYGTLSRSSASIFSGMKSDQITESVEMLAEEILVFFSDADSYRRKWLLPKTEEVEFFERGVFTLTYDGQETEASEKAERGDFRALEELILERGYLRTFAARKLVVDRIRGIKKRGSPASEINTETYLQIATIQFQQKCSEFRAKKIWLEKNLDVSEETLSTRVKRAKKTDIGGGVAMILTKVKDSQVQNSGNPEP